MSINAEESLKILDSLLATSHSNLYLSDIQEAVFLECWKRYSYQQIADRLGYDHDYIKVVGSRLWRLIFKAVGKKVTKSNVHSLIRQYASVRQLAQLGNIETVTLSSNYVTETIVKTVAEEITEENIALFNTMILIKSQGKDYLSDSQIKGILEPLIEKLISHSSSKQQLEAKLKLLLALLD
jgi:hypothetical protein